MQKWPTLCRGTTPFWLPALFSRVNAWTQKMEPFFAKTACSDIAYRPPADTAAVTSTDQSESKTKWRLLPDSAGGSLRCDFGVRSAKNSSQQLARCGGRLVWGYPPRRPNKGQSLNTRKEDIIIATTANKIFGNTRIFGTSGPQLGSFEMLSGSPGRSGPLRTSMT